MWDTLRGSLWRGRALDSDSGGSQTPRKQTDFRPRKPLNHSLTPRSSRAPGPWTSNSAPLYQAPSIPSRTPAMTPSAVWGLAGLTCYAGTFTTSAVWPAPARQETLRKRGGPPDKSFNFLGLSFLISQCSKSCLPLVGRWRG